MIELQENGWIKDGENDKYVKDGQVLTDCVEKSEILIIALTLLE